MLIRFRKEDGTEFPQWEKKQLNNLLIPIDKTPVDTSLYKKITVGLHKKGVSYNPINREMVDKRPFYIRHSNELIIGKQNYFNGSIAIIPEKFDGCICSNAIMSFTHKDCDIRFLYEQISEPLYLAKRYHLANGTGQKELSEKDFLHFSVELPCLEEQQKIADFLSTVDQKIESQKTIVADYEELKKGTMQKIFNQEIRFKDDDGNEFPEWEEKKLGEVSYLRGRIGFRGYTREDIVDSGGVISLSPTNINNGYVDFKNGTYISEFKYEESPEIKLAKQDIVFVKTASIGKIGYIKELQEKATINPQIAIITAQGINPFYLFLAMNTKENKAFVRSITAGGVVPTLSQEDLKKMIIPFPCLEEQKKIADCLSALDRKIEAEKKILADLEELKKGLLQGIFNN